MKLNANLQNQILPLLNTQVEQIITSQRERFQSELIGLLETLEELEKDLDNRSPIDVEISLEDLGEELQAVTKGFVEAIGGICGNDGALSLVRKIRGETDEEITKRKERRTAKLMARKQGRLDRLAEREEKKAARLERQEARKKSQEAKGNKKTAKKTKRSK